MPTLLKIGADVTGAEKVERLAKDLREAANATDSLAKSSQKGNAEFKTMSSVMGGLAKEAEKLVGSISQTKAVLAGFKTSLDSIWSSSSVNVGLKEFQTSIKEVGRDLSYSRQQLSDFITTSGQYATLAQANAKATHATSVALRAEEAAMNSLLRIEGNYVAAKAKELLLTDKAAIALTAETAAVNAQIAAYQKLNASGAVTGGYNKKADYASLEREYKSEDAMIEHHIATLQAQEVEERRVQKARNESIVSQMTQRYQSEDAMIEHHIAVLKEQETAERRVQAAANKSIAESMQRNYAGRDALKYGSYTAKESTTTSFSNIDVESVAKYDAVTKKLLNAKEVMAAFDTQMNKTATVSKGFFASLIDGFPTLSKIGSGFDDLTKKGGKLHATFRGMSGAAGQLWLTYGQMAPMIAGFAAISGTMKTISTGINFDFATRSFQDLAEGADKSAVGLQNIQKELLAMSNLTSGPGELAAGLLEFARAGISAEEAMQGIAEVSRFAYLGEMDMAKATEIVVGQLTAFKNLDTGKALNIMALVADRTSISLNQMSEAFKNTTSLGTVLGVSFDDVAVAIGAMGQAGIRGATAGAALTTMMYKLTAPTAAAEKKMRELGVAFSAINKNTGGLKTIEKIIKDLAAATKGLTEGQKGELFESMVGLRGLKALGALVDVAKEGTVEFEKMRVKVKAIFNEVGGRNSYLEQRFNNLTKSGKVQLDILKAELDKLFISSYDNSQTVEALAKLTKIVSDPQIKEGLASIVSGVISVSSTLVSFTNTFGGVLLTGYLGKIIFGKITAWTAAAGEAAAAIGVVNAATLTMVSAATWTPWLVAIGVAVKSMWDLAEATNRVAIERAAINKTPLSDAANTFIGGDLGVGGDLVVLQQEVIQGQEDLNDSLKATKGYISGIVGVSKELSEEEEKRFDAATDFLNKLEEQTTQLYKTPIEVIRDEQVQALDDFSARMAGIRESFDATEEGQRNFNNRLEKGKETINKFYDGKLLKALDSEISGMETAWKNHFLSVLSGYEEMLDKQKDLSSRKGVITTLLESGDADQVPITPGLPTQNPWESTIEQAKSAGKSISEEFAETVTPTIDTLKESLVEVNAELEKSGSQARNVVAQAAYYKEWEKSLSGVALATKDFIESKLAFSKSAAEDQGLSNLIATAEEQKKAIISLGKAETDLYQGTVISKKAYEESTEAVKAKIRAIVEESEANATLAKGTALTDARMENAVARYKKLNESDATYLSEQKANADEGLRILEEDYKQKKILDTEYAKDRNTIITNTLKDELDAKKLALMRAQKLVEEFASSSEGGETELSVKQIALLKDQEVALREVAEAESNLRKEQLRTGSEVASMTLERTTSILLAESQLAAAYGKTYEASVKQLEAEKAGLQNGKDRVTLIKEEIIELKKRQAANDYEQEMLRAQAELLNLKGEIYSEDALIYEATLKQLQADQLSLQYGDEKLNAIKLQVVELKKLEAATKTPYEAMQKGMKEAVYSGKEMAEDIQRATENAFDSMTDAIVDFVKTGKMNFSDLTDSILTDLLTIMVRANVTNTVLSAMGMSSYTGLAGGAATSASGAAAASGMNVGGLGGLFNSGSTIAGGAASLLSGWGADLAFSDSAFSGLSSTLFDVSDLLSQNLTVGSGILAGVGSLTMSLLSGQGLTAQTGMQAGGAALGTILAAGNPLGGVLGGIVGSLVGGMFGTGVDTFQAGYMSDAVGVNYDLVKGMVPTTAQFNGGDTDSRIAKVYAEQIRSIQVAFNDQVDSLVETLPEEISSTMLNALSSVDLQAVLDKVSAGEIEVGKAEEWLTGVAEDYSDALMAELGKAYGTALSSFISTNGAEGLIGDSSAWAVLTDAVKENITASFQEAATQIAGGDIDAGLSSIQSVTDAIAAIESSMAPITEIIATDGLTEYEKSIRAINLQFDSYRDALKAAGVDMEKYTDLEKARGIALAEVVEKALAEVMTPVNEIIATSGMSDYELEIRAINQQFDDYAQTVKQSGGGVFQLIKIEKARAIQLSEVVNPAIQETIDKEAELAAARKSILDEQIAAYESLTGSVFGKEERNYSGMSPAEIEQFGGFLDFIDGASEALSELRDTGAETSAEFAKINEMIQQANTDMYDGLAQSRLMLGDATGALAAAMRNSTITFEQFNNEAGQFVAGAFNSAYLQEQARAAAGLYSQASASFLSIPNAGSVMGALGDVILTAARDELGEVARGTASDIAQNNTYIYDVVSKALMDKAGREAKMALPSGPGVASVIQAQSAASASLETKYVPGFGNITGSESIAWAESMSALNYGLNAGKLSTNEFKLAVEKLNEVLPNGVNAVELTTEQMADAVEGAARAVSAAGVESINYYFGQLSFMADDLAVSADSASQAIASVTNYIGLMNSAAVAFGISANAAGVLGGGVTEKGQIVADAAALISGAMTTRQAAEEAALLADEEAFVGVAEAKIRDLSLMLEGVTAYDTEGLRNAFVRLSAALGEGALTQQQYAVMVNDSLDLYEDVAAKESELAGNLKTVMDEFRSIADSARSLADDLLVSESSTLDNTLKMEEAQRQYRVALAGAMDGDQDAMGNLSSITSTMLSLGENTLSDRLDYQRMFATSIADIRGVETINDKRADEAAAQLAATNALKDEIAALREEIKAGDSTIASNTDKTRKRLDEIATVGIKVIA